MEKVTVYVPKELKQFLKDRKIPMSQFCRSAIKHYRRLTVEVLRYQKTPKGRIALRNKQQKYRDRHKEIMPK